MAKKAKKPRVFSIACKQSAVERMLAGENVTKLARELSLRRKLLYEETRDVHRAPEISTSVHANRNSPLDLRSKRLPLSDTAAPLRRIGMGEELTRVGTT